MLLMTALSVIIPLAPNETEWQSLLADLSGLPDETEILFTVSEKSLSLDKPLSLPHKEIRWITAAPGRAAHMNAGAFAARGDYLWFLHADTRFGPDTLAALSCALQRRPNGLLFFDLAFSGDSRGRMRINAWGARFRSRVLRTPFGDQGFLISKELFKQLGAYREGLAYGEDHVFVIRARQQGIAIEPAGATLYTSARKYKKYGWLKTTLRHQYLWIRQAWTYSTIFQKKKSLKSSEARF
jgi:GT2 family glycosyltransferase